MIQSLPIPITVNQFLDCIISPIFPELNLTAEQIFQAASFPV
ncbi:MAG: hypothetical protein RMZ69_17095 [Nostoc sp. ChiQUE01a]|nr:hypothetical protein [Nostoc sp. ChiQUE01a]